MQETLFQLQVSQDQQWLFTLNKLGNTDILPSIPIDPPIMAVQIGSNTSPLAGKDGGVKLTYG